MRRLRLNRSSHRYTPDLRINTATMKTQARLTDSLTEREQRNRQLSFLAATESIVLLANDGALPLAPCRIALYGAGAEYTIKGGSGSGEVNVRHTVSVLEGLEQTGFDVVGKDWINRYDTQWKTGKQAFLRAVRRRLWWPTASVMNDVMASEYRFPSGDKLTEEELAASGTDTCLYVLSRQSGEGHDMRDVSGSFRMDDTEIHNIRLCAAHFARFILVINTGCPIDLSPIDNISGIRAIVYMGQLGMQGGRALATVLTGEYTPSAKLAVTWPKTYADVPFGSEFADGAPRAAYKEGIYVGYRYYDSFDVAPRYPFGYGLSYTTFALSGCKLVLDKGQVHGSLRVTNTGGTYAGREVVQVYARCPGADCEYQRLVAFAKTDLLAPGQEQVLTFAFPLSTLSSYDEQQAQTVIEAGGYLIGVGTSSRDIPPAVVIRVKERIILCRHRHLCASSGKVAELHHPNNFDTPAHLPELIVDAKHFTAQTVDYTDSSEIHSQQVAQVLTTFTPEDCIRLCVGTSMSGEDTRGDGFRTPGAVGHTTTAFVHRGIPNLEFCDGPAGVRLERRAVRYPSGEIRAVDISLSVYEYLPSFILRWFVLGNPDKGQLLYQFVTAFPVEAMLAQTWNTTLVEQIGRAVGEEMVEYGVTFWLAPAMNIVRNPLCGRNYEYYSEDPLLTGLMAAAVTQGVQHIQGCYATVKHFCANNQETDRFTVSTDADERVLREIYWRGFEIVVRQAHPRGVMAAYNRLNDIYCAESRELCTDLLRHEWGFEGVVMTDWFATDKGRADAAKALQAGVDLMMPGSKNDTKALRKAYQSGLLPGAELRCAAARMLQVICDSKRQSEE